MDNYLDIPFLNPVRFYAEGFAPLAGYNNLHFDDNRFRDQVKPWEEAVRYNQKWQKSDIIYLQFASTYAPIYVDVMTCEGNIIQQFEATIKTTTLADSFFTYEVSIALSTFNEGVYYLRIRSGIDLTENVMVSEPFHLKTLHENTLLINYKHSHNREDVVFATGIAFNIRVEGHITDFQPGAEEKGYIDQTYNTSILSSVPYRAFKLIIGGPEGVPDYMPDIMERIFGCDIISIDGKLYAKADNAKFEKRTEERYPMAAWVVDLREGKNRSSNRLTSMGKNGNYNLVVVYQIDTGGFGDLATAASSNVVQVTDNKN